MLLSSCLRVDNKIKRVNFENYTSKNKAAEFMLGEANVRSIVKKLEEIVRKKNEKMNLSIQHMKIPCLTHEYTKLTLTKEPIKITQPT